MILSKETEMAGLCKLEEKPWKICGHRIQGKKYFKKERGQLWEMLLWSPIKWRVETFFESQRLFALMKYAFIGAITEAILEWLLKS